MPPVGEAREARSGGVRIDKWLWAARFYKTRALARQAIETGKVEVGGQRAKPSRSVRIGDALVVVRGDERFEVEALGLSDVRGPASVAQALYRESEASILARALGRNRACLPRHAAEIVAHDDAHEAVEVE